MENAIEGKKKHQFSESNSVLINALRVGVRYENDTSELVSNKQF